MAVVTHGVSTNTPERYLFGAGTVYYGWTSVASPGTVLGAALGGCALEINRGFRDIRPDGSKGPVKGFRRVESVGAKLTVMQLEITEAVLLKMLPGAAASSHVITGAEIDDDDYFDLGYVLEHTGFTMTSDPLVIKLSNCIAVGPFKIDAKNNEEAIVEVTFEAHYADSDLSTEPWEVTYPS